ncbi:hypothetical protein AAE478_007521 [Parahypoxylon ruwenzoriense]
MEHHQTSTTLTEQTARTGGFPVARRAPGRLFIRPILGIGKPTGVTTDEDELDIKEQSDEDDAVDPEDESNKDSNEDTTQDADTGVDEGVTEDATNDAAEDAEPRTDAVHDDSQNGTQRINHPRARGVIDSNGMFRCVCGTRPMKNHPHNISSHLTTKHTPNSTRAQKQASGPRICAACGAKTKNFFSFEGHIRNKHGYRGRTASIWEDWKSSDDNTVINFPHTSQG